MICEFMCKKFDFSTHGCAILFAHTTTPVLLDQALEFFKLSSTPSPFILVVIPSLFPTTSSTVNLSLFVADHAHENPLMRIISFVILWALSPTLKVDVFINNEAAYKWVLFFFLLGSFHSKFVTFILFELFYHFWEVVEMNRFHPYCFLMMATFVFHQVLLASEMCQIHAKHAFDFNNKPMFNGINFWLHFCFWFDFCSSHRNNLSFKT